MNLHEQVQHAHATAENYADLVFKLITIGVQSYMVNVATAIIFYRFENGVSLLGTGTINLRKINDRFDFDLTVQAVKNTQQGKTDYAAFMDEIAMAGVQFYEATLTGDLKVTYVGAGGYYEEAIDLSGANTHQD